MGAAGLVHAGALGGCSRTPARRNIVVVVMDSVRRDHISCYGHTRPTSPCLDQLAAEGRRYANAYSTSCWTVPAHASLLTGLYPVAHGANWENIYLSSHTTTLAGILGKHGYRTALIAENPLICAERGFGRGFNFAEMCFVEPRSTELRGLKTFMKFLTHRPQPPVFCVLNLNGAHKPYDGAGPFEGRFLSDPAYAKMNRRPNLHMWLTGKRRYTQEDLDHLAECYDEEICRVDSVIGRLVRSLKDWGMWDSTALIVTANHGENFGDHDLISHQLCLYESLVRIPLVIRCPGLVSSGSCEDNPVQLTDLFATVLELAGVNPQAYRHHGCSLVSGKLSSSRPVLCEHYEHIWFRNGTEWDPSTVAKYGGRLRALVCRGKKLIERPGRTQELYDLAGDPDEVRDLAGVNGHQETREALAGVLEDLVEGYSRDAVPTDFPAEGSAPDATEDLEALGYL